MQQRWPVIEIKDRPGERLGPLLAEPIITFNKEICQLSFCLLLKNSGEGIRERISKLIDHRVTTSFGFLLALSPPRSSADCVKAHWVVAIRQHEGGEFNGNEETKARRSMVKCNSLYFVTNQLTR